MPERLKWILDGRLAGMALPGLFVPIDEDLAAIVAAGIGAIATLTEYPLPAEEVRRAGLQNRHFPIDDFDVPTIDQVADFCSWVDAQNQEGRAVAAHCYAGLGRTGTMVACYLVREGLGTTPEILERIRELERGYVQTPGQEAFIAVWEAHLRERG